MGRGKIKNILFYAKSCKKACSYFLKQFHSFDQRTLGINLAQLLMSHFNSVFYFNF